MCRVSLKYMVGRVGPASLRFAEPRIEHHLGVVAAKQSGDGRRRMVGQTFEVTYYMFAFDQVIAQKIEYLNRFSPIVPLTRQKSSNVDH